MKHDAVEKVKQQLGRYLKGPVPPPAPAPAQPKCSLSLHVGSGSMNSSVEVCTS